MRNTWASAIAVALLSTACSGGAAETGLSQERESSTANSPAPSTAPAPSDGLTGYGATREAWDSAHQKAPGFTDGAAYLPLVRGNQPKFYAVSGDSDERIYSYSIAFEDGTNLASAKAEVLKQFPPGAKFDITDDDEPRCLLVSISSPEVEETLDEAKPMVGFFSLPDSDTTFTPDEVQAAIFTLAFDEEGGDLGMC